MNIKILKNSKNGMPGIDYNENKTEKGKGDLLVAKNFNGIDAQSATKKDYAEYMEAVCALNPKVKAKQLHAVVTSRGREYSFEELKNAAVKYLDHMGYKNNPYLIYKHNDTENNHVHIVTTRVDKEGKKVSDKFEHVRSQKFIKNVLKIDHGKKYDKSGIMSYGFSTHAQFKLLLEGQNFRAADQKDRYLIYSGRQKKDVIAKSEIDRAIRYNAQNPKQIAKVKALFRKYKPGLAPESFISEMRKNFGIEIILHHAKKDPKFRPDKNYDKPYGYTVIDHKNKQVYKGSQIQPLSFVLNEIDEKQHRDILVSTLRAAFENPRLSLYELNKSLQKIDFTVSYKGIVRSKALDRDIFEVDGKKVKELLYYNKVHLIDRYYAPDPKAFEALRSHYRVNATDLNFRPGEDFEKTRYYEALMEQQLSTNQLSKPSLDKNNLKIIGRQGEYYLIDLKEKAIVAIPETYHHNIHPGIVDGHDRPEALGRERRSGPPREEYEPGESSFSEHLEINLVPDLGHFGGEDGDDDEDPIKRKRKNKGRNNRLKR